MSRISAASCVKVLATIGSNAMGGPLADHIGNELDVTQNELKCGVPGDMGYPYRKWDLVSGDPTRKPLAIPTRRLEGNEVGDRWPEAQLVGQHPGHLAGGIDHSGEPDGQLWQVATDTPDTEMSRCGWRCHRPHHSPGHLRPAAKSEWTGVGGERVVVAKHVPAHLGRGIAANVEEKAEEVRL